MEKEKVVFPLKEELNNKLKKAERDLLVTIAEVSQQAIKSLSDEPTMTDAILVIQTVYLHSLRRLTHVLLSSLIDWAIEVSEEHNSAKKKRDPGYA